MDLVIPDFGLLFWMVVSFSILLIILRKFALNPLLKMLQDREDEIAKYHTDDTDDRADLDHVFLLNEVGCVRQRIGRRGDRQ